MKIYCINLRRAAQRRVFMQKQFEKLRVKAEFIPAIDGRDMDEKMFREVIDQSAVERSPNWLTRGVVACTLSHRLCYEKMMIAGESIALILEDDVILETDAMKFIDDLGSRLKQGEILLLYFQAFPIIEFSESNAPVINDKYRMMYPINFERLGGAGAYIITRDAARSLFKNNLPISLSADSWGLFFKQGFITSVRVLFPFGARSSFAESTIDYLRKKSWQEKFKHFISTTQLFPFYQLLKQRRRKNWIKTTQYYFTSQLSEMQTSLSKNSSH